MTEKKLSERMIEYKRSDPEFALHNNVEQYNQFVYDVKALEARIKELDEMLDEQIKVSQHLRETRL